MPDPEEKSIDTPEVPEVEVQEGIRFEQPAPEEETPAETPPEPKKEVEGKPDELTPDQVQPPVVEEPEKVEETPPAETPPETPEAKPGEVVFYTNEEIAEAYRKWEDDGVPFKLDRSKLTPDQQAAVAAVQGGLTPKLQERTELKRQVDELQTQVQQMQQAPPQPAQPASPQQTVEQMFKTNPQGTLNALNAEIATKESEDPYGEEAVKLRQYRDHLITSFVLSQGQQQQAQQTAVSVFDEVRKSVPEYDTKAPELNQMAYDDYSFTKDDISVMTHPNSHIVLDTPNGRVAYPMSGIIPKFVTAFNDLYDRTRELTEAKAEIAKLKGIPAKEVKEPTPLESAGSGFDQPVKETGSMQEYHESYFADKAKNAIT